MKKIVICLLLAGVVGVYFGCKKDPEKVGSKNIGMGGDPTAIMVLSDFAPVNPQLKELAKGFAWWAYHNNLKRKEIHNYIEPMNDFTKSTGELWSHFQGATPPFDLENEIYDANMNHLQSLIYNRDFFDGFEIMGCTYVNQIYIPDADLVDTADTLIIVPGYIGDGINEDSIFGYWFNNNTGFLDSVLIDETTIDDYYIWCITSENDCDNSTAAIYDPEFCNKDNNCDELLGESWPSCADCPPPAPQHTTLYLWEIQHLKDWKKNGSWPGSKHQESWFAGDYEIDLQYVLTDVGGIKKSDYRWEHFGTGIVYPDNRNYVVNPLFIGKDKFLAKLDARGSNAEVKKCKKNWRNKTKCNRGSEKTVVLKYPISHYHENNDQLVFVLQEFDRNTMNNVNTPVVMNGQSYIFGIKHNPWKKPYTQVSGGGITTPGSIIDFADPLVVWTPIVLDGKPAEYYDYLPDTEFRMRFVRFL